MRLLLPVIALLVTACASSKQDFAVRDMTSLTGADRGDVRYKGLEFLADVVPGRVKPRVNIVYLHGIGWTEDPDADALADDFVDGVIKAYGLESAADSTGKCVNSAQGPQAPRDDLLYITAPAPIVFDTAIPGATLSLDRLVCMDRQIIDVSDTLDFAVYRIFWDDIFWNGLQFAHVGQDDDRGSSQAIAQLRRKYNRRLKDELVNYGFSDAVLYLGEAGESIRAAVRGALCAAHLDAGGYGFAQQGVETSADASCQLAKSTAVETNQFAFVTESLGSKIGYDLMREAMTDGRDGPMDDVLAGSEVYMLANQIPLLSLSDLTTQKRERAVIAPNDRPTVVALSEVNDFLTYEIVPFLRQIWSLSSETADIETASVRADIAERLGFNVIDLRVEYADPLVPIVKGLVDPLQAHGDHSAEPELMRLLLCGVVNGELRAEGCLAAGAEAAGDEAAGADDE